MELLLFYMLLFFVVFASNVASERTVLIDCGSTGSRVYVYYFDPNDPLSTISELSHRRAKPGLSSFVGNDVGLRKHVNDLVAFAKKKIPLHLHSRTTISLKATAGLRELSLENQTHLIAVASRILSASGFVHHPNDTKVLSGAEEALYGLLGIMPGFKLKFDDHYYAVADLGGSSQQIAFIHSAIEQIQNGQSIVDGESYSDIADGNAESVSQHPDCHPNFILNIPGYGSLSIMARSLSQMGLIAAMDSIDSYIYNNILESNEDSVTSVTVACASPGSMVCTEEENAVRSCHPPLDPTRIASEDAALQYLDGQPYYAGEGNFTQCVEDIRSVLLPQLRNFIDFSCLQSHLPETIIGIDNYPKVLEMLKLGGDGSAVTPQQIEERGKIICQTPWEVILADFPGFMPYRAQRACFGSSFIYVLLMDLFGIDSTSSTVFKPVNNVEQQELSWAAGAAVYSALGLKYVAANSSKLV